MKTWRRTLPHADRHIRLLRQSLKRRRFMTVPGFPSVGPFMAACFREALGWRSYDLARSCARCIRRNDVASATIILRSLIECLAVSHEIVLVVEEGVAGLTQSEVWERLDPLMLGQRWEPAPQVQAPNILGLLKRLNRVYPTILELYNALSDVAHPNSPGVSWLFGKIDLKGRVANFGPTVASHIRHRSFAAEGLRLTSDAVTRSHVATGQTLTTWQKSLNRNDGQ